MAKACVFISGRVQGVGYRYFVKSWARKLGIGGFVRNLVDGRVECVFQGEKKLIEEMIEKCRKGPFLAEVRQMSVEWEEIGVELEEFRILD